MPGLCILTLTIFSYIITGSVCHVDSAIVSNSANKPIQYDDEHQLRRLKSGKSSSDSSPIQYDDEYQLRIPSSHPSSSEAITSTRDLFTTIFRDVALLLNSLNPSLHEPVRRKYKRSQPGGISQADSRMLKQVWDAYSRHKYSTQGAEDRYFLFPNFDSWADSFTMYFWRDMAFNVFKIVGLSALYYLAPGVLSWYTQTFGSTV